MICFTHGNHSGCFVLQKNTCAMLHALYVRAAVFQDTEQCGLCCFSTFLPFWSTPFLELVGFILNIPTELFFLATGKIFCILKGFTRRKSMMIFSPCSFLKRTVEKQTDKSKNTPLEKKQGMETKPKWEKLFADMELLLLTGKHLANVKISYDILCAAVH